MAASSNTEKVRKRILELRDRWVFIVGPLDEKTVYSVQKTIFNFSKSRKPIVILINSSGGDPDLAIGLFNLIDCFVKNKIITVNFGVVSSSAFYIFLSGNERYITERCFFRIHNAYFDFSSQKRTGIEEHEIETDRRELRVTKRFLRQIITLVGLSNLVIKKGDDILLDPWQAKERGIVHEVIPGTKFLSLATSTSGVQRLGRSGLKAVR